MEVVLRFEMYLCVQQTVQRAPKLYNAARGIFRSILHVAVRAGAFWRVALLDVRVRLRAGGFEDPQEKKKGLRKGPLRVYFGTYVPPKHFRLSRYFDSQYRSDWYSEQVHVITLRPETHGAVIFFW